MKVHPNTFWISTSTLGTATVGNNPDFNYPVKIGGAECLEADFLACTPASEDTCCVELRDPNSAGPGEVCNKLCSYDLYSFKTATRGQQHGGVACRSAPAHMCIYEGCMPHALVQTTLGVSFFSA